MGAPFGVRTANAATVARIERSEIRGRPIRTATPPPGFATAQPGLRGLASRDCKVGQRGQRRDVPWQTNPLLAMRLCPPYKSSQSVEIRARLFSGSEITEDH